MADIYASNTKGIIDQKTFGGFMEQLPEEEQSRVLKYRQYEDQKRALLGTVLIRSMICLKTGLNYKQCIIQRDEYGKPFLENVSDIHFNLSHSGEWVVCILGNREVGIDVEEIKPIDISIGERCFSNLEYENLMKLSQEQQLSRFYELWTLKESYTKAIGKGLSIPLKSFSITFRDEEIKVITQQNHNFLFGQYDNIQGYKIAACSRGDILPSVVNVVEVESLMNMIRNQA